MERFCYRKWVASGGISTPPLFIGFSSRFYRDSKFSILLDCGVLSVTTLDPWKQWPPTSFRCRFCFSHKTFSAVESITEYFAPLHESNFWEITHKFLHLLAFWCLPSIPHNDGSFEGKSEKVSFQNT